MSSTFFIYNRYKVFKTILLLSMLQGVNRAHIYIECINNITVKIMY